VAGALERRLRGGDMSPHLESHIAKYRKLVPALALIMHLANGNTGPIGELSLIAALAWAEYLEGHAVRIYQAGKSGDVDAAKAILRHLKAGRLPATFTARDVRRNNWSGVGDDPARVKAALEMLEEYDWLKGQEQRSERGGRPTKLYTANPKGLAA